MTALSADDAAHQWASEILETQWESVRFRLELEEERWRSSPGLEREHYQARFRVWELSGIARVDSGPGASPASFPAETERLVEVASRCEPPRDASALKLALERAASSLPPGLSLQVRGVLREPARRGGARRLFVIEKSSADCQLVIDYDPESERRLGYLCGPFYRGSTRSAAISKATAVRRATQALGIPVGSKLTRARVEKNAWGRVWRLRWDVDTRVETGAVTASLNARSGQVCAFFSTVLPRPQLHASDVPSLERATREIARAAQEQLGEGLVIGEPIPTALGVETGVPRAAWIAVVRAPDRRLYRALHDGQRVELRLAS